MQFVKIRQIIQLQRMLLPFLRQKDFQIQIHSINNFYSDVKLLFTQMIVNYQIEKHLLVMEVSQILQKH